MPTSFASIVDRWLKGWYKGIPVLDAWMRERFDSSGKLRPRA